MGLANEKTKSQNGNQPGNLGLNGKPRGISKCRAKIAGPQRSPEVPILSSCSGSPEWPKQQVLGLFALVAEDVDLKLFGVILDVKPWDGDKTRIEKFNKYTPTHTHECAACTL